MKKYIYPVRNSERMKPINRDKVMEQYDEFFKALPGEAFQGKGAPVNVYGILAHRPEISRLLLPYCVQFKHLVKLTPIDQELIILRMACLYGSDYVWGHHAILIKEFGFSEENIAKIPFPPESAKWDQKIEILLTIVDELVKTANISDENWKKIVKFYSNEQILDILTVVSQYLLFCSVNNVFGVKLEESDMPLLPNV